MDQMLWARCLSEDERGFVGMDGSEEVGYRRIRLSAAACRAGSGQGSRLSSSGLGCIVT